MNNRNQKRRRRMRKVFDKKVSVEQLGEIGFDGDDVTFESVRIGRHLLPESRRSKVRDYIVVGGDGGYDVFVFAESDEQEERAIKRLRGLSKNKRPKRKKPKSEFPDGNRERR